MVSSPGQANVANDGCVLKNVTGAAIEQYGVYALDFPKSNAATLTLADQLTNVIVPTAATLGGRGRFFVARTTPSNLSTMQGLGRGIGKIKVSGAVNVGDLLMPTAGQNYTTSRGSSTNQAIAQALGSNSSGTAYVDADIFGS